MTAITRSAVSTTGTGPVDTVTVQASIDFGLDALAIWARGKDFFDVLNHLHALCKGHLQAPVNGVPCPLTSLKP